MLLIFDQFMLIWRGIFHQKVVGARNSSTSVLFSTIWYAIGPIWIPTVPYRFSATTFCWLGIPNICMQLGFVCNHFWKKNLADIKLKLKRTMKLCWKCHIYSDNYIMALQIRDTSNFLTMKFHSFVLLHATFLTNMSLICSTMSNYYCMNIAWLPYYHPLLNSTKSCQVANTSVKMTHRMALLKAA